MDPVVPSDNGYIDILLHHTETSMDIIRHNTEESLVEEQTPNSRYTSLFKNHPSAENNSMWTNSISTEHYGKHSLCRTERSSTETTRCSRQFVDEHDFQNSEKALKVYEIQSCFRCGFFSCPNCGFTCIAKSNTSSKLCRKHHEKVSSRNESTLRHHDQIRCHHRQPSCEERDISQREESSTGYPWNIILKQRPQVSPRLESETNERGVLVAVPWSQETFQDYFSDSVLPGVEANSSHTCVRSEINSFDAEFGQTWPQRQSRSAEADSQNNLATQSIRPGTWPLVTITGSSSDEVQYRTKSQMHKVSSVFEKTQLRTPLTESSSDRNICLNKHQTELWTSQSNTDEFDHNADVLLDETWTDSQIRRCVDQPLNSSTSISFEDSQIRQCVNQPLHSTTRISFEDSQIRQCVNQPLLSTTRISSEDSQIRQCVNQPLLSTTRISFEDSQIRRCVNQPLHSSTHISFDRSNQDLTNYYESELFTVLQENTNRDSQQRSKNEPFDLSSFNSLDETLGDGQKRWTVSEPFDLSSIKSLDETLRDGQKRRTFGSRKASDKSCKVNTMRRFVPRASSTGRSLELFNISQCNANEDQIERCPLSLYDEVNSNRYDSKSSLCVKTASFDDMTGIAFAILHARSGLIVKDRCWLKCLIPNAIVGRELTHWLWKNVGGIVSCRDAEAYAQEMINHGFLRSPISCEKKFIPQWYYTVVVG